MHLAPPCMRIEATGRHKCRTSATIVPKQLFWHINRYPLLSSSAAAPSLDTLATRPRSVQSYPSLAWTSSDLLLQFFGETLVVLHHTRPIETYGTSAWASHVESRSRERRQGGDEQPLVGMPHPGRCVQLPRRPRRHRGRSLVGGIPLNTPHLTFFLEVSRTPRVKLASAP